jgi:hypothetical protein
MNFDTVIVVFLIVGTLIWCGSLMRWTAIEIAECETSTCPGDMKPVFDRGICRCHIAPVRKRE